MRIVWGPLVAAVSLCNAFGQSDLPIAASVNKAPNINGKVEGSVQQMQGQGLNLNSSAEITGDLLVPGTPNVNENGSPQWSGLLNGTGSTSPSGYTINLNSGAKLGYIIQQTDSITFDTFSNPPSPSGNRTVHINQPGDVDTKIGDWATLKNLTLNTGNVTVEVPAGTYGNFSANGSGGILVLGTEGATEPEVYNFQKITLNSNTGLEIRGPVVLHVKNSLNINSGVEAGAADHPEWLTLKASNNVTINSNGTLYGYVQAPAKQVMVNGLLVGAVVSSDRLTVNSNGVIRGVEASPGGSDEFAVVIDPESGPAPLSVLFQILNGDPAIQYHWDLGDGTTFAGTEQTHVYQEAGYYLVTLTLVDGSDDPQQINAVVTVSDVPVHDCELYPIALPKSLLDTAAPGQQLTNIGVGDQPGNFGWLSWDGSNSTNDLVDSLTPPGTSALYVNPDDASDSVIDLGDWLQGHPGVSNSSQVRNALDGLIGVEIHVPVWDEVRGQGSNADYRAAGVAAIKLVSYSLPGQGEITFEFVGSVSCGALNYRPTVELIEPEDQALFQGIEDAIPLRATASDSDGTIERVLYFADNGTGNALIGEGTGSDYLFDWTPTEPGNYRITAVAIDNGGLAEASESINITVNAPPTVAITSPTEGTLFSDGGAITVTASAEDEDGTVTKVQFFADSGNGPVAIGEDTEAPYSITWENVDSGAYTLTATATDDLEGNATSEPVTLVVNQMPVVSITAPVADSVFQEPGAFTVVAEATDADGTIDSVEFFIDGASVGSDVTVPFEASLTSLVSGSYVLTAQATDNLGSVAISSSVTVAVNAAPTISLTAPTDGEIIAAPGTPTLTADASDSDGSITLVEFFIDGAKIGEDTTAPYGFTTEELVGGTYALSATATDDRGGVTTSEAISLVVNERPTISITNPVEGTVFQAPGSVTIEADTADSDGTIATVRFFINGTPIGEDATAPFSVTVDDLEPGDYVLTASATDDRGFAGNAEPINITVNAAPTGAITAPLEGAIFQDPADIAVAATASDSDGAVSLVELLGDGVVVATDAEAPYEFTWNAVPVGTHVLEVRITDDRGGIATSSSVNVLVNAQPTVAITAPADGSLVAAPATVNVTASASDSDGMVSLVEFFANGNKVGEATTAPYTITLTDLAAGTYVLTSTASDDQGGSATSAPITLNVNAVPTIALTAPLDGAVINGVSDVTLTAAAADADGSIAKVEFFVDGAKVGESTTAPFTFTVPSLTVGTYALTAVATDDRGAAVTSSSVGLIINGLPSAAITTPDADTVFTAPAEILIEATAIDPEGAITLVEFFAGSDKIGESTTAPYTFTWQDVAAGEYALTVLATDSFGTTASSGSVPVVVNAPPVVAFTTPQDGTVYQGVSDVLLTADASDADGNVTGVEFFADNGSGSVSLGQDTEAPYEFTWTSVIPGSYTLTAQASDDRGATTTSDMVSLIVNAQPEVLITSPLDGAEFEAENEITVEITATDADGTISLVTLFADAGSGPIQIAQGTAAPFTFAWTPETPATYTLSAEASDDLGGVTTSAAISVVVEDAFVRLKEESDVQPTAVWELTVPETPGALAIPYRELVFDSTDVAGINDAFELALLDADGVPLIETTGELRDSFYNITEGEDARLAVGVGSEVVDEDTTIYVDISTLTPGTEFQLVARLINNDTDTGTEIAIGEVSFVALDNLPSLDGTEPGPALIVAPAVDVNSLREMGSTAGLLYSVTSANEEQGALVVEAAVVNLTAAPLEGSLIVVVDQFSDPNVQVQNPDGVTSSGQPYFNFSALFPADGLNAGALTPARSLVFLNPDAVPFTYELILLGEPNRDPIWQSSPSTEALVGETFTYTGVATDPDGDTISYSVVAGPTGLGINGTSGALTWTPASPGSYSIVLEASDGRGGEAQQSFTVLATDEIANRPPAFQSRPDVDAALGNDYSYSAQATDPDGDGVTYSLTTKPEGMAVNPATGQVTWSPTLVQRGEHSVVLRVEDGRGGVASQAYRVKVGNDPANNPPAFVTEAPTAFSVGLPGTASGPVSPNALVLDAPPGTTRTEQVSIIAAETGGVTPHVVFIVDESGSMAGEQAWIADAVLGLDSSLNAQGVFDTKYSMLGFNGFTRLLNAANFEGTVRIISPEGNIIQTRSFGFPNDQSGPSTFTALAESGEYRILVEPSTSSAYGIRNTILEGDLSVPITGFNQTYQATLANGEQIEYLLSAPAGTQIRGSALIRTTPMTLQFVAPSGATFTPQEAMLLPESGEYRVIIRAFDNGSFTYRPFILNGGTPVTIGEEVSGTTSSATGMVFYEFEAEAGQELFLETLAGSQTTGNWRIRRPDGLTLAGPGNNLDPFSFTIQESGTHLVEIEDQGADLSYSFHVKSLTPIPVPMQLDTLVSGEIATLLERDLYTFEAQAGDAILLHSFTKGQGAIRARLYDPAGEFVTSLSSFIPFWSLGRSGTYTVEVDTNGEQVTGTYSFEIGSTNNFPSLPVYREIDGMSVILDEDEQYFSYEGKAGETFETYADDGLFEYDLYAQDGTRILVPDLIVEGSEEFLVTLPADGTYTFFVSAYAGAEFDVYIYEPQDADLVGIGEAIEGSGDIDFDVDGPTATRLWFDGREGNNDHIVYISGDYGDFIGYQAAYLDGGAFVTTEPGATYGAVYDFSGAGEPYRFVLLNFDDATPVEYGVEVSGTLSEARESRMFRLPSYAGGLEIKRLSATAHGRWHIVNPSGETIKTVENWESFEVGIPGGGDYFLVLDAEASIPNPDYSFVVNIAGSASNPAIDRGTFVIGTRVEDTFEVDGDSHLYSFTGQAGDILFAQVSAGGTLRDPQGNVLGSAVVDLPETGTYTYEIGPGNAGQSYAFQFIGWDDAPDLPSITSGSGGGIQVYRWDAEQGDRLRFDFRTGTASSAAAASTRFVADAGFGNQEDGYVGMSRALTLPFAPNDAIHFVLISDDDRERLDFRTPNDMYNELSPLNVTVSGVVSAEFQDGANQRAIGVAASREAYLADGSGGFTTSDGGRFVRAIVNGQANPQFVESTYINLFWRTGGANWDLNLLRAGGADAQSFSAAFGQVLAADIAGQSAAINVISSDDQVAFENLTGPLAGVSSGASANFNVRFTGDEAVRDFDLLFVNESNGSILGSIPVLLNDSYRYRARAVDADGDTLSYSLVSGPAGASVDAETGRVSWAPTEGGTGAFTIKVSDGRGGEAVQTFQVTVSAGQPNGDPVITSQPPTAGEFGKLYSYRVEATDPDGHPLAYFLDEAPSGMAIDPLFGLITWTPNKDQLITNPVQVRVIDRRGGEITQAFTVDVLAIGENNNPVITSTPADTVTVPDAYRYQIVATDPDNDGLTYSLAVGPDGMAVDATSGVLVWEPGANEAGTVDVLVRAEDGRGGVAIQTFQVSVDGANYPPLFASTPVLRAVVDRPYEYRPKVQDADGDSVTFQLLDTPPGVTSFSSSSGRLLLTPSASDLGDHFVTLLATDTRGGQTEQTFILTVVDGGPNTAPEIVSSPPARVRFGDTFFYAVEVEDPDADPITYSLGAVPTGLNMNEAGFVAWTPSSSQFGSHSVEIVVNDGFNTPVSQTFTVEVVGANENLDPQILSTPLESATVDAIYAYDIEASDPDGDALAFILVEGPRGLSIDPLAGSLRWVAQEDQLGPHNVVVEILDNHGGLARQSYTVSVRGTNLPPEILSRPNPEAAANVAYEDRVTAFDPEGDPLSFRLAGQPAGLEIDDETGVLTWTPAGSQIGIHPVTILVEDGQGGITTQAFDLVVREFPQNQPPNLEGNPVVDIAPGADYESQFTALDPEEGDITFLLVNSPDGMVIDPATGLVTWTAPLTPGTYDVTVLARDPDDGLATITYRIRVAPNSAPTFTSTPPTVAVSGQTLIYRATAPDPDGDPVNYAVVDGPAGATADVTGAITWTVPKDFTGDQAFTIRATDRRAASTTQSYTVTVSPDTGAPQVEVLIARTPVQIGETVAVQAIATDNGSVADLRLEANGEPVAIDGNGIAVFTSEIGATFNLVASAIDGAGNTTATTPRELRFLDPADTNGPEVILNLNPFQPTGGLIYEPMDLTGTVTDDNLEFYRVEFAPVSAIDTSNPAADDPDYRLLASSTDNITNGVLAAIDPTTLANDSYYFRVYARDFSGNINVQGVILTVAGQLKLGRMAYAVTDLNIPLVGIPIQITRIYDSLEAHRTGDFGYGWKMALREANIEESVPASPPTSVPDILGTTVNSFKLGTRVTLTGPDGRRVSYRFVPELADLGIPGLPPGSGFFGTVWKPRFIPEPGTYSTLEAPDTLLQLRADGTFVGYALPLSYNPDTYTLTTRDGTKYSYNQFEGLQTITDRNQNVVTFTRDGIFHSSGASITYTRNAQDRITAITDPNGNDITYDYDARGDLVKVTDQEDREVNFTYYPNAEFPDAPAHYLDKLLDANGVELSRSTYEPGTGRLSTVTDGTGHTTQFFYDSETRTETKVDTVIVAEGVTEDYIAETRYDERGNVVYTQNPYGGETSSVYGDSRNPDLPTEVTPPCGCTTTFTYDANGNVLTQTTPKQEVTRTTYDAFDNPLTGTDALGRTTRYAYDGNGDLTTLTDAAGNITELKPNTLGRIDTIIDARGFTTAFEHDGGNPSEPLKLSRPTKVTYSNGDTLRFTYGPWGNVTSFTDPSGATQQLVTDEAGMLKQRVLPPTDENPDPAITRYNYNTRGELERVINARDETTEFIYDEVGRLRFRKDANDNTTEFTWDELGRLKKTFDPLDRVKERFYRQDGAVDFIRQADGTEIHFEYDAYGNRTALIDPNNNRTEFRYDGNNRLIEQIDPLGKSMFYTYDAVGNVTQITDRLDRVRLFDYDALDRLVKETWITPAGEVVKEIEMTYDAAGNLVTARDDVSDYAMTYDNRNRVDVITAKYPNQDDFTLDYNYDDANRTSTVTDNAGVSVTSITNTRAQLRTLLWQGTPAGGARVDMGYNQLGDKTSAHRYTSVDAQPDNLVFATDYRLERGQTKMGAIPASYNASNTSEAIGGQLAPTKFGPLDIDVGSVAYPRAGEGYLARLTSIIHSDSSGALVSNLSYDYDEKGQLVEDIRDNEIQMYSYDSVGQLTDVTNEAASLEAYEYDNSGNLKSANGSNFSVGKANRILEDNLYIYTYDAEVNLTEQCSKADIRNKSSFEYDHRNRLVKVQIARNGGSEKVVAQYIYDIFNRRILKEVMNGSQISSFHFRYEHENIWYKKRADELPTHMLSSGVDQWIAEAGSVGIRWHVADRIGSIIAITDETGALLNSNKYSAFGVPESIHLEQDSTQFFGFTGREHDTETGLMYYRARYYDPQRGKFLSEDPIGFSAGDFNVTRYVFNSPLNWVDPTGTVTKKQYNAFVQWAKPLIQKCARALGLQLAEEGAVKAGIYLFVAQGAVYTGQASNFETRLNPDKHHKLKKLGNRAKNWSMKTIEKIGVSLKLPHDHFKLRQLEDFSIGLIEREFGQIPNNSVGNGRRELPRGTKTKCDDFAELATDAFL